MSSYTIIPFQFYRSTIMTCQYMTSTDSFMRFNSTEVRLWRQVKQSSGVGELCCFNSTEVRLWQTFLANKPNRLILFQFYRSTIMTRTSHVSVRLEFRLNSTEVRLWPATVALSVAEDVFQFYRSTIMTVAVALFLAEYFLFQFYRSTIMTMSKAGLNINADMFQFYRSTIMTIASS